MIIKTHKLNFLYLYTNPFLLILGTPVLNKMNTANLRNAIAMQNIGLQRINTMPTTTISKYSSETSLRPWRIITSISEYNYNIANKSRLNLMVYSHVHTCICITLFAHVHTCICITLSAAAVGGSNCSTYYVISDSMLACM